MQISKWIKSSFNFRSYKNLKFSLIKNIYLPTIFSEAITLETYIFVIYAL